MNNEKRNEIHNYMDELRVLYSSVPKIVEKGKFLQVAVANYTLANNQIITREEIIKKNNDATIIMPVTKEGKIILVIQPRPLTKEGITVELPAGYIDDEEPGVNAAIRELTEETGYTPMDGIEEIGEYYQDQGCSRGINKSFIAYGCEKVKDQSLDCDEHVKYFECSLEEMMELLSEGYIKSANSALTIKLGENLVRQYIRSINVRRK